LSVSEVFRARVIAICKTAATIKGPSVLRNCLAHGAGNSRFAVEDSADFDRRLRAVMHTEVREDNGELEPEDRKAAPSS